MENEILETIEEPASTEEVILCKPSDVAVPEESKPKKKAFFGIGLKTVAGGATMFGAGYLWHKRVSPKLAEYNAYRKEQRRLKKEAKKARKAEMEASETED